MTRYAFVDATVATEILPGITFVSPITGESFADNWLILASQADREGKAIWPITPGTPPTAYDQKIVSRALAVVAGLPVETITAGDRTVLELIDIHTTELQAKHDTLLNTGFWYPENLQDQDHRFAFRTSGSVAILGLAVQAEAAIVASVPAADYAWRYGGAIAWAASTAVSLNAQAIKSGRIYKVTTAGTTASSGGPTGTGVGITDGTAVWGYVGPTFSWPNVIGGQISMDAFQVRGLAKAQTSFAERIHVHYQHWVERSYNAYFAADRARMLGYHAEYIVDANWSVDISTLSA